MLKNYALIVLFFTLFSSFSNAQNGVTISKIEGSLCAGTDIFVSYTTQGTFNAGNKFRVQYRNILKNTWTDLKTEGDASPLKVSLPTILDQLPSANVSSYYFRIVSSLPTVEGNLYGSIDLKILPSIEILSKEIKDVNPYDLVNVQGKILGATPVDLLLSDSTSIKNLNSSSNFYLNPSKSGEYSILQISNVCGLGTSTGKVNIRVNQIGINVNSILSGFVCHGSALNVGYSSSEPLSKNNKFKIRLVNGDRIDYELDAIDKDGILSAVIPNNVSTNTFRVSISASEPQIISPVFSNPVSISEIGSVEVISPSTSIGFGESVPISILFRGMGPHYAKLNDGTLISSPFSATSLVSTNLSLTPEKTIQYFTESFSTGCGEGVGKQKTLITVNGGIKTENLPKSFYCAGETIKIPIKTNISLPASDKIWVRFSSSNNTENDFNRIDVEAKLTSDNIVECVAPMGIYDKLFTYFPYYRVYSSSYKGSYNPNAINILEKPTAKFGNLIDAVIINPGEVSLSIQTTGGGISNITINDSINYSFRANIQYGLFLSLPTRLYNTTVFKLTAVENACGTTALNANETKKVTVTNPLKQGIFISKLPQNEYCNGSKMKVDFRTEGIFNADNEFTIELIQFGTGVRVIVGETKLKTLEFTLPVATKTGTWRIQVSSNSPIIVSDFIEFFVKTPPIADYYIQASTAILIPGDRFSETIAINGGGNVEYETVSGVIKKTQYLTNNPSNIISLNRILNQGEIFGIKSIKNECGVGTILRRESTIIHPYRLTLQSSIYPNCVKSNLELPVVKSGFDGSPLTYSIQIAKGADTTFTILSSKQTSNIAKITIPSTYTDGGYRVRIISEDGLKITSNFVSFRLNINSSNVLSTSSNGNEVTIDGGVGTNLVIKSESPLISYVIQTDKKEIIAAVAYRSQTTLQSVNPNQTTIYSLKIANNECGYGNVSGSAKVIVRPNLKLSLLNSNAEPNCMNFGLNLNIDTFGSFEKDNKFDVKIYTDSTQKISVFSSPSGGKFNIKLPATLSASTYQIEVNSSNPKVRRLIPNVTILATPEVVLAGGGAIINSGDRAALIFTINPSQKSLTNETIRYQLSDSTSGNIFNQGKNTILTSPIFNSKTFTLISASNACGSGKVSGSAKVIVNPASAKQVNINLLNFSTLCQGAEANIGFTTKGTFTATNKFTVQLSDINSENFKNIKTDGNTSPLKAFIPADLPLGSNYRFRIIASDNDATSTTDLYPLEIRQGVTARFDTSFYNFESNKSVAVKILFSGTPPYSFTMGSDEINAKPFFSNTSPYFFTTNPISSIAYRLFKVSNNECGIGTILPQNTVTLQLITSSEELHEMGISIFPNPTTDMLKIESDGNKTDLILFDMTGKSVLEKSFNTLKDELNLQNISTGQYLLKVQKNDKMATYKVIKY